MAQAGSNDVTAPYEKNEVVIEAVKAAKALIKEKKVYSDVVSKAPPDSPYEELQWVDLVTAGGGMLGVGLLGYTYILEQVGIRFVGLGGTSAGAINTMLIATRRKAPDQPCSMTLLEVMAKMPFTSFMDGPSDTKEKLNKEAHDMTMNAVNWKRTKDAAKEKEEKENEAKAANPHQGSAKQPEKPEEGKHGIGGAIGGFLGFLPIGKFLIEHGDVIQVALKVGGLHRGKAFESWMKDNIDGITNVQDLNKRLDLSNMKLAVREGAEGQAPTKGVLNIVAADITTQTRAVFPEDADCYWQPGQVNPSRFVRASMSIPFFFTPMRVSPLPHANEPAPSHPGQWQIYNGNIPEEVTFVDGGMLSNFPMDLFNRLDSIPLYPTFGVQLGNEPDQPQPTSNPLEMLQAILESSRHILDRSYLETNKDKLQTIGRIDTALFNWLDFNMSTENRIALFAQGAKAAAKFLNTFDWDEYKNFRKGIKDARQVAKGVGGLPSHRSR